MKTLPYTTRLIGLVAFVTVIIFGLMGVSITSSSASSALLTTPQGARFTALAQTATALKVKIEETASALSSKIPATKTALAGKILGTATVLSDKISGTATALVGKFSATGTAFAGKVAATLTAINAKINVTSTLPADQAAAALMSYAAKVLGTTVTVTSAGGVTAEVTKNITQTAQSANAQVQALALAVTSYGGILSNGAAFLSYGTGTISGNIDIDVQAHSLGIYTLIVPTTTKLTADTALALAQSTFPAIASFPYAPYAATKGFAWYSLYEVYAIEPQTHQVVAYTETVILYVLQASNGKSATVTATVGRGDFATLIPPQK